MGFGLEKCAVLVIEEGQIVKLVGIELPDEIIKSLQDGESYKYIGILELDRFLGGDKAESF